MDIIWDGKSFRPKNIDPKEATWKLIGGKFRRVTPHEEEKVASTPSSGRLEVEERLIGSRWVSTFKEYPQCTSFQRDPSMYKIDNH